MTEMELTENVKQFSKCFIHIITICLNRKFGNVQFLYNSKSFAIVLCFGIVICLYKKWFPWELAGVCQWFSLVYAQESEVLSIIRYRGTSKSSFQNQLDFLCKSSIFYSVDCICKQVSRRRSDLRGNTYDFHNVLSCDCIFFYKWTFDNY
jgi:hypothetical protein